MSSPAVYFEHEFDERFLRQINNLRRVQLGVTMRMLENIDEVARKLDANPDSDEPYSSPEIIAELHKRKSLLEDRLNTPNLVHADEISYFIDILNGSDPEKLEEITNILEDEDIDEDT